MRVMIILTLIAFIFYVLSFFVGYVLVRSGSISYKSGLSSKEEAIEEIKLRTEMNSFYILFEVLKKNLLAWAMFLAGALTVGIFGTIQLCVLGISLGFEVVEKIRLGVETKTLLWLILPHGILEMLGFSLVVALGYWAFRMLVRYLKGGILVDIQDKKIFFYSAIVSFAIVVLSAFIEAFITPVFIVKFGF